MTKCFPEGFTEENNADPDGEDDLKFTQENIQQYFLMHFKQNTEKSTFDIINSMIKLESLEVLIEQFKKVA